MHSLRSQTLFLHLLYWTGFLWLGGCVSQTSAPQAPPTQETVLRISVQPTQDIVEQERMIVPLDAHLEKVLGQQVDFIIAKDYQDSVNMLVDGRANAAYAGVVSYLEALERGVKVKPLVAPIDQYTVRPWYRSCIIVAANSPIKSLKDLKGKRVAFVDRSSTSGYLVPFAALKQEGINPDRDFAKVVFSGTHAQSEALLAANRVDAIATNLATYNRWQKQDNLAGRLLWESQPIPHAPVLVVDDLPPQLIEKLKEAFLTTPSGIKDLMGTETVGYTMVEAEDYESIREIRRQIDLTGKGSRS
ncbi:MAG: phosphate/phosphite/phosphonate ABC transporter substrate-binding protein [Methylacidiphilales bacterium]|nr:phosphate/phosphite/phosphonate ABC transporter substrate-binding protein [Candidatus Methylacidiphilales bacterium]